MPKNSKYVPIILQGVLSALLLVAASHAALWLLLPSPLTVSAVSSFEHVAWQQILFPSIVHLVISCIGAVPPLFLPQNSRNEVERRLLPLLFFAFALSDVPIFVISSLFGTFSFLPFSVISRVYVFSLLFSTLLLLFSALFHLGINTSKLSQFILLGLVIALLIASLVPLSVAGFPLQINQWISGPLFIILLAILNIISCVNYMIIYFRERSRHNLLRCGGFVFLSVANILLMTRSGLYAIWTGVLFYAAGVLLVSLRGRL